jgi:hypothetical protein
VTTVAQQAMVIASMMPAAATDTCVAATNPRRAPIEATSNLSPRNNGASNVVVVIT